MKSIFQGLLAVVLVVSIGMVVAQRMGEDVLNGSSDVTTVAPVATLTNHIVAAQDQDATAAIQQVIQRSNDEQVQAIAARDPSLMQDTLTGDHYRELVQINQDLLDHGVSSISLMRISWGDIKVDGNTATVTTFETWRTTYSDGRTEQSRDQNDYTLVLDSGAWKIKTDEHPEGTPPQASSPPQLPVPSLPGVPTDNNTSHNWSGYAASNGRYTAVTGTWIVPEFSADGPFGIDATWVGIGGVHSRDLIQAGTEQTVSGSGHTEYEAWVETLPRSSRAVSLSVHPGDSVTVAISEQSLNNWLIQFTNNTTGQTYQETQQYTSSHSSAEWVEEAPSASGRGGILPLSDFGSVEFSNATAVKDGQTVTIASAGGEAITMVSGADQALAVPSALNADGSSFTVARTDAPATRAAVRRRGR